ncbi:pectate lyase [Caulifigura coniformis]|uniref:pectate lyase n=1 Tax=Caulifigura coniformis TaxID=2527983 RepID=UPI0018D21D5B|nr:pectate lyase [Caulifigura coniformis]
MRWQSGFRDGIKHYRDQSNRTDYARYREEQTREIADNLLLHQRANGGWPPNFDPLRILTPDERRETAEEHWREDTSLDNHASYPNTEFLAWAYSVTRNERHRDAAVRGLEFLLKAQYPHGGWPHSWPNKRDYRPHVTIVDGVMVGVLTTLHRAADRREPFQALPPELAARVGEAVERGDRCLLALQVKRNGVLTGWASQYDEITLKPTQGRSYELPALISSETVGVLEYLMSFDTPTAEMEAAIEGGARWLEESQIRGLRIVRVEAETIRYQNHTSRDDVVAIEDATAPVLWARFYDLETNEPVLANRDGLRVKSLAEVERERRTGYSWYGGYASHFLKTTYPAWRAARLKDGGAEAAGTVSRTK